MAIITRVVARTVNADQLLIELAGLPLESVTWAGFSPQVNGRYAPVAGRQQIGYSSQTGPDYADPGELRIATSRDLTPQELSTLDGVLASHDHAAQTPEQLQQAQDTTDLDAFIATERARYQQLLQQWDSMTNAQKQAATKEMFTIVGKLLRIVVRRERQVSL